MWKRDQMTCARGGVPALLPPARTDPVSIPTPKIPVLRSWRMQTTCLQKPLKLRVTRRKEDDF
jgi:hypothetical protein